MRVWISKERVWWYEGSEDKPSASFFSNFENRMEINNNIRVRFINYNEVELVSPTDDISYVKVEHNNKVYYYYVTGINLIANNSYNLTLLLDVYTTYTIPFLNELNASQTPVKAIRHLSKDKERLYQEDELLNAIPKSYKNIKLLKRNFNIKNIQDSSVLNKGDYIISNDGRIGILKQDITSSKGVNPVVYYVFSGARVSNSSGLPINDSVFDGAGQEVNLSQRAGFIFIPVLGSDDLRADVAIRKDDGGYVGGSTRNSEKELQLLAEYNSAQFLGVYLMPNFLNFSSHIKVNRMAWKKFDNSQEYVSTIVYIDGSKLPFNIAMSTIHLPTIEGTNTPSPYADTITDEYLLKYMRGRFYGGDTPLEFLAKYDNGWNISFNNPWFTYSGNGNIQLANEEIPFETRLIQMPFQLPSTKDTYLEYVQATQASANANYQVTKEQNKYNLAGGIASTILGTLSGIGNIMSGGLIGGISSAVSGGINIGREKKQLRWKRMQMQAHYKDKLNTSTYNLLMSTAEAMKYNRALLTNDVFESIEVYELSTECIKQLNFTLYYYGYYAPKLNTMAYFLNLKRDNSFTYILLEQENLTPKIALFSNAPKDCYEDIIDILCGGVRIWDKTPTFSN